MSSSAAATVHEPQLSPERLDCYRVALEFNVLAARLVQRGHRDVRVQLTRAALSVSANLAEGCGRRAAADKAHFIAIARGSAMECAAIVDVIRSLGLAPAATCKEARWLLVRIVQMLTRLAAAPAGRHASPATMPLSRDSVLAGPPVFGPAACGARVPKRRLAQDDAH